MKLSVKALRLIVEEISLRKEGMHRCMDGQVVPQNSPRCQVDLQDRLLDTMEIRDTCPRGTAIRSHYNGVLQDLRQKLRSVNKIISIEENI